MKVDPENAFTFKNYQKDNTSALAIPLVCKQTYLETTKLYYSRNTFHLLAGLYPDQNQRLPECRYRRIFSHSQIPELHLLPSDRLKRFVVAIGPVNAASIAKLSVDYGAYPASLQLDDSHQSFQPTHLEIDYWSSPPHVLMEYVEARKGTGLRLTLLEGATGTQDSERHLARQRRFVARANDFLAISPGVEATSFYDLFYDEGL